MSVESLLSVELGSRGLHLAYGYSQYLWWPGTDQLHFDAHGQGELGCEREPAFGEGNAAPQF